MNNHQVILSKLARVDAIYILEIVHMLQEVLLPEPHIFLVRIQAQQSWLCWIVEGVQVQLLMFPDLTPKTDRVFSDAMPDHLEVGVAQEIPVQVRVGLLTQLLDVLVVELELGGELVHDLGHAVQELQEHLGFLLAHGVVHALAEALGELVPEVDPVLLYQDLEALDGPVEGVQNHSSQGAQLRSAVPAVTAMD